MAAMSDCLRQCTGAWWGRVLVKLIIKLSEHLCQHPDATCGCVAATYGAGVYIATCLHLGKRPLSLLLFGYVLRRLLPSNLTLETWASMRNRQ